MKTPQNTPPTEAIATFAGGCFWCMQPAYDAHPGVIRTVVGFSGGTAETADYTTVVHGGTQHRESVQVHYDPTKVTYPELIDIFWRQIDPTDPGGQFADRGHHYTTAIYYHTPEQKADAEAAKQTLQESKKFDQPVATVIEPYTGFWPASEYHQQFYKHRALYYQQYKQGSGRAGFISENWAKEAALAAEAKLKAEQATKNT